MKRFLGSLLFLGLTIPQLIGEKPDAYRGLASSWTMIPSRSLAGLHYLFKGYEIQDEENIVKVTGPVVEITDGQPLGAKIHKDGFSSEVDLDDFEYAQELGLSVFEAISGPGTDVGTAFLVGKNLVMTNRHVMGIRPGSKALPCGKFSIKLNHRDETVACHKVRFCSSRFDYCLVEMMKMETGQSLASELKPLRLTTSVKQDRDMPLLHIGNAGGLGIQVSSGRGLQINEGEFYHYVPTLGGSSGAPIFNDRGKVIGINWGHTGGNYVDDASFNRGVLISTIFNELMNLNSDTLFEIRSFRSSVHRLSKHQQKKIDLKPISVASDSSSIIK